MRIAFYNVENLFDTLDDPYVNDESFLPESGLKWNQKRYVLKLQRLARVIKAIEDPMPMAIGLAEVENRKVLSDLVAAMGLTKDEVGIIHDDSPDERGIDVGLLYRRDLIKNTEQESHSVIFEEDYHDKTRDILQVNLELNNGETLHIFVNHWPSRREGAKISMPKRFQAANTLSFHINKLFDETKDPKIVVMGDFNCDPDSPPVRNILDKERSKEGKLINLSREKHNTGRGSLNFKGKWLLFDQILTSPALIDSKNGLKVYPDSFDIFFKNWMLVYNAKFRDFRPNKTYGGRKYHGGFSDHLPVYISVNLVNK